MDRLTEFVSKSFDGRHDHEEEVEVNSDNNNIKTICASMDMSKETLDREALERAACGEYDDHVDVTGDHDVTPNDAHHQKPASPAAPAASSTSLIPATTGPRDAATRPAVAEALLHHRAAFLAHKDAPIISEFTQRHPFGIDRLSVKLQENAAAAAVAVVASSQQQHDPRSSSSPLSSSSPSPPQGVITIPTSVSSGCVSSTTSSLPTNLCSNTSNSLTLPSYHPRPLVSPSCNKGLFYFLLSNSFFMKNSKFQIDI